MGRKETEEAIADSRAGRVTQFGSVAELMADLNADDTPDQVRAMQSRATAWRQYMMLLVGQAQLDNLELAGAESPLVQ